MFFNILWEISSTEITAAKRQITQQILDCWNINDMMHRSTDTLLRTCLTTKTLHYCHLDWIITNSGRWYVNYRASSILHVQDISLTCWMIRSPSSNDLGCSASATFILSYNCKQNETNITGKGKKIHHHTANKTRLSFYRTLRLTMMYHHTTFGQKRISSSAAIIETVISQLNEPSLWP